MRQQYISPSEKEWIKTAVFMDQILSVCLAQAQEGSHGNTTILGGAEIIFFADHNRVQGSDGPNLV